MLAGAFTVNGPCSVGAGAGSRPPWSTEARVTAGTVSTETPRRPAGVVDGRPATPRPRAGRSFPGFTALVVDDHPLVRESIVARLRAMGAREVIEAASAHEARARARASGPGDLAILDLGLPDGSGLDLLVELREAGWGRLVVLSAGVRRVLDGGVYADPSVASLLAAGLRGSDGRASHVSEMSGREVEVLRLVSDGQSNKQVAARLGLSALTVKSHLARIARKLGTGDRAEMVALAMRAGVIR